MEKRIENFYRVSGTDYDIIRFMNKSIIKLFALSAGSLVLMTGTALAVTGASQLKVEAQDMRQNVKDQIIQQKQDINGQIKNERADMKAVITATTTATGTARMAEKQQIRANFKDQIKAQREDLRAKIDQEKQTLKTNLLKIKDQARQAKAEEIANNLNTINEKKVTQYSDAIDKIQAALTKVSSKADILMAKGADVTAARTAISSAQTAIDSAKAAISAQTVKTYPFKITTAANLQKDVSAVRDQFQSDTAGVKLLIEDAKRFAVSAVSAFSGIMK